jgi:hypothetical protein
MKLFAQMRMNGCVEILRRLLAVTTSIPSFPRAEGVDIGNQALSGPT